MDTDNIGLDPITGVQYLMIDHQVIYHYISRRGQKVTFMN